VLSCQLQPRSSISVHSPMVGVLRVYVDQPQTNLPANFVWGEFEPTIFAAQAEALEEARIKLDERERLQMELEIPRQRLKLERELEESQRQVKFLSLMSTNAILATNVFSLPGHKGTLLRPDAVSTAEQERSLLEQSLGYLKATNLIFLGVDLPGQRSEWQRQKLEFERRQAQARMKMPFDGQLTVALPLTDGVEEYPVNSGQELAVARDLSTIRLRVVMSNAGWVGLPPERMMALVRVPNGEDLRARFLFQKIERIQMREESVYYFQFSPEQSQLAARLMGTDVSCELWLDLPQPARIVPKLSLVLKQPEAFQGRNWEQGVSTAWPGARILVEGQTDLAIVLPEVAAATPVQP
jgi:hypothetical protein